MLPTDRPHTVKLSGAYDFKWGTTLGANWFIESGVPQTTVVRFTGYPCSSNGRNDLGRAPVLSQLDLNIIAGVQAAGPHAACSSWRTSTTCSTRTRGRLSTRHADMGHESTSSKTGTAGSGTVLAAPFPELLAGPYNPDALSQTFINSGGNLTLNPFYTTPNSFQGRRQMRLQAKFTF